MPIDFPSDKLPYPVRDDYAAALATKFNATQMDDETTRVRRMWNSQAVSYAYSWLLSWSQLQYFEAFLRYDLANGSAQFNLSFAPGLPSKLVQFSGFPQIAYDSTTGAWKLSGSLYFVKTGPNYAKPVTLPIWPAALPEPETDSYTIDQSGAITWSTLLNGTANARSRFQAVATVQMTWLLDATQEQVWEAFAQDELLDCVAPFIGFVANGEGLTQVRMRFIEAPTVASNGAAYKLTGKVEVVAIPVISEFDYRGNGQLAVSDSYSFTATSEFGENGTPLDTFTYNDAIALSLRKVGSETYAFQDSVSIGYVAGYTQGDTYAYADSIALWYGLTAEVETYSFAACVSISIMEYVTEDYCTPLYTMDPQLTTCDANGNPYPDPAEPPPDDGYAYFDGTYNADGLLLADGLKPHGTTPPDDEYAYFDGTYLADGSLLADGLPPHDGGTDPGDSDSAYFDGTYLADGTLLANGLAPDGSGTDPGAAYADGTYNADGTLLANGLAPS